MNVFALLALFLQAQDPVDRLIWELKNSSGERQDIARFAIGTYGESVAERLKRAGLELTLIGGRARSKKDQELLDKLKSIRITVNMENVPLSSVLNNLSGISGLSIRIDIQSIPRAGDEVIAFKVSDVALDEALKLMLTPRQMRYTIEDDGILITSVDTPEHLPPQAPVRLLALSPDAPRRVAELSAEAPEEREKAIENLRRLGFAAEGTLWEAMGSPDAETRARAGELLRELYTPQVESTDTPAWSAFKSRRFSISLLKQPAAQALETFSDLGGISVVVDARRKLPTEGTISMGSKDMPGDQALSMLGQRLKLQIVFMEDWLLVTHDASRILGTRPYGPLWTDPERARRMEDLIGRVASDDTRRSEEAIEEVLGTETIILGPLLQASHIFPADSARRCRLARERYIDRWELWMADEPASAERQTLTENQRAILVKPVSFRTAGESLEDVLRRVPLTATVKPALDLRFDLWARQMKTGTLLRALTGPYGLDFCFDGDTVVIDTAARIRPMVK